MVFNEDKNIISSWDEKYVASPEYEQIFKFILEYGLIHGLDELIETNYERIPIGDNEVKKALTFKNDNGEILGFMIYQIHDIKQNPSMFLQYFVINPEYQHQGYGKEILRQIFSEPKKYLGYKPNDVFCYIDNENFASQGLFMRFGLGLKTQKDSTLFKGSADMPAIEAAMQSGAMGSD